MAVFEDGAFDDHEHVSFFSDASVGLRAIVAIHRTGPLGTAGGGCRMWPYRDEREAVRDVLRLSRAMTHKLALVELPAGGAKAVVIGDPARDKSEGLLRALGRAVDRLGGRFVLAEDVGTTPDDLAVVAKETLWVDRHAGGDTSWATAYGVLQCMRAAVRRRLQRDSLGGVTVAVQGLGRVGRSLARQLAEAGAHLVVTDLNARLVEETVRELGARAVAPAAIFDEPADVFAPCALADALDESSVERLRCAVVAGSANNQLAHPAIADTLADRGILYAPDLVCNAGGVLGAAMGAVSDQASLRTRLDALAGLLDGVLQRAERERISTQEAAERTARDRFRTMGGRP